MGDNYVDISKTKIALWEYAGGDEGQKYAVFFFSAMWPGGWRPKTKEIAWNVSDFSIVNIPANKSQIIKRWKIPVAQD